MPPSQFPDDMVSVVEEVADLDRVVAALLIISRGFLLVVVGPEDLLLLLVLLSKQHPIHPFLFFLQNWAFRFSLMQERT